MFHYLLVKARISSIQKLCALTINRSNTDIFVLESNSSDHSLSLKKIQTCKGRKIAKWTRKTLFSYEKCIQINLVFLWRPIFQISFWRKLNLISSPDCSYFPTWRAGTAGESTSRIMTDVMLPTANCSWCGLLEQSMRRPSSPCSYTLISIPFSRYLW